jgi:hypothetical protein
MRHLVALAAALLVAVAPHSADATRKTPSTRASALTNATGAHTTSVNIPPGSTWALIFFSYSNVNGAPSAVTLDGQSATKIASNEIGGLIEGALYKVSGFSTGSSKTLGWTNPSGIMATEAAIEYRDGTPTYGATDADRTSSGTLSSSALANTSGDEILCGFSSNPFSLSAVGSGQTQLDATSGTSYYGFTTETGAGGTEVESWTSSGGHTYACVVVTVAAGGAPTFPAGPTYATVSNTQISATFTASAASLTYYCALYGPGATPPTAAEVAAGTNAHSSVATGSTTGSSEAHTMTATDSPSFPQYDPYCVLYNGSTYSAVPTTSTKTTTPPTGFQYVTLASVTATGSEPKAFNDADLITLGYDTQTANFTVGSVLVDATSGAWAYIRIDVDSGSAGVLTLDKRSGTFADNDVLYDQSGGAALVAGSESAYLAVATSGTMVVPTTVSPSLAALTVDTSGQYRYTANGRQTALGGLLFHAATRNYFSMPLDAWFNNAAPDGRPPPKVTQTVFKNGDTIDYDVGEYFSDADGDTLTYARLTSLPAGTTFNPTTGHLTGTVNVDASTTVSFIAFDAAGDYASWPITFTVETAFPAPNCVSSLTLADNCAHSVLANTMGSVFVTQSYQCSATIASGYVISQNPSPAADMVPGSTFALVASSGNVCSIRSPDCTSLPTTTADCEDLYTSAYSGVVSFATGAKCNNSIASGYVISTSPKAHTQTPLNANISITSSLGVCSTSTKPMVNCIAHTLAECSALVGTQFGTNVTIQSTTASCTGAYTSGQIYSQSPGVGTKTHTPAVLNVKYCQ